MVGTLRRLPGPRVSIGLPSAFGFDWLLLPGRSVPIAARLVLVLARALAVASVGWHLRDFARVDQCLDAGGRWNRESRSCEFHDATGESPGPSR